MLDIRIAAYQFREPNTYIINETTGRLDGILGVYYQSIYDLLKWNVTYIEKSIIKNEKNFSSKKYDNDDVFFENIIDKNYADFYFRQIQIDDALGKKNIRLSPVVSTTSTRMLQCIHRKDDFNNRDILIGLNVLDFSFWFKLFLTFLSLSFLLGLIYYAKKYYRLYCISENNFIDKLNMLIMFLLLFHMRLITRQSSDRKLYRNLDFIRYLILIVTIFVTIVLNQLLSHAAFQNLKFRNTSYILRNLDQVLKDPEMVPCFLESETVVNSKINYKNSIIYKLYKHHEPVCFLSSVMVASSSDKDVNESTRNAINRLLTNVLIGSDEYVEYFGYLFCSGYSEFIRTVLSQTLKKTLIKELPLFWNPIFISEEINQAFFINKKSSKSIQDEIYFKFVYWTFEHGWIQFLKYIKHKIDPNPSECFTSDLERVLYPYRFSELLLANFLIIISVTLLLYSIGISFYLITWFYILFNQHIQIIWIKDKK